MSAQFVFTVTHEGKPVSHPAEVVKEYNENGERHAQLRVRPVGGRPYRTWYTRYSDTPKLACYSPVIPPAPAAASSAASSEAPASPEAKKSQAKR